MPYATLEDLCRAATGGWDELAQRSATGAAAALVDGDLLQTTVEDGDRTAWSVEAQLAATAAVERLQDALDRASRHADTYLFPRYRAVMPLSPELLQGSDLPSVVAAIALRRLYGTSVPEDLRNGTKWADDYLVAVSKGTVSLGAQDTAVAQPAGRTVARTQAKAFDWARY